MMSRIGAFLVSTLFFSGLLTIIQQYVNLDSQTLMLPQLAPAFGCLLVHLVFKDVAIHYNLTTVIGWKIAQVFLASTALLITALLICKSLGLLITIPSSEKKFSLVIFCGMLLGAFGEEIGWRSFLQPAFDKKYSLVTASSIVGLIWGLWHIGLYKNGVLFMTGFLMFSLSASIILSKILYNTKYNLLISVAFHFSINIGFLLFFNSGYVQPVSMVIIGIVWLIAACAISFKSKFH